MQNEEQITIELMRKLESDMFLYQKQLDAIPTKISKKYHKREKFKRLRIKIQSNLDETRHNWSQLDEQVVFPHDGKGVLDLMNVLFHLTFTSIFEYHIWKKSKGEIGSFDKFEEKEAEEHIEWVQESDDKIYKPKKDLKGRMEGPYTFNIVCYCIGINPENYRKALYKMNEMSLQILQEKYAEYQNISLLKKREEEEKEKEEDITPDPKFNIPTNEDLDSIVKEMEIV